MQPKGREKTGDGNEQNKDSYLIKRRCKKVMNTPNVPSAQSSGGGSSSGMTGETQPQRVAAQVASTPSQANALSSATATMTITEAPDVPPPRNDEVLRLTLRPRPQVQW